MKHIFVVLLLLCCNSLFAQTLPDFDKIKLEKGSDYKDAEPAVLKAAAYVLTTPLKEKDSNRSKSLAFIIKWMSGTPDYTFAIDETATTMSKDNAAVLGLYLAAMTQYCLENPASATDQKAVELNAVKKVLTYCENPANNVVMTKQLKKFSEANKKGELEKEL